MSEEAYEAVPVHEARKIAERYRKAIVVIVAYDTTHQKLHTTTFGVMPEDKDVAALWGEACATAIGADTSKSVWYENYRTTTEAEYKRRIDELEAELESWRYKAQGNRTDA